MGRKKVDVIWLIVSIVSFALMSTSFVLMPLDKTVELYDVMDIILGAMFWLFLILGVVTQIILITRRKKFLKMDTSKAFQEKGGKVGLISVFKNIPAIVADVGFIISLVAFVIATKVTNGMGYSCYILLAVCTFTFCLHCIFNGKNFDYVIEQSKNS